MPIAARPSWWPWPARALPPGQREALLFLRPEKVGLAAAGQGSVDGTVRSLQYLGDAVLMEIDIGEAALLIVSERIARIGQPARRPGERLGVVLDPGALQVLAG